MRELLIALNRVPGVGSRALARLLSAYPDLGAFQAAPVDELAAATGLSPAEAARLQAEASPARVAQEERTAARLGAQILTLAEGHYPAALRTIPGPPGVLYIHGDLAACGAERAVAVVGSRRASAYGAAVAFALGRDLALAGVTVVSGLARGIDGAAHRGALAAAGRTVAVLGAGLDRLYPAEHRGLAGRIVRAGGALITEFPFGAPPLGHHFPRRNRVIAGLSQAVVVVEAAARSGSLITARLAAEAGREVMAVPGPVTSPLSVGTRTLLRLGARAVGSAQEILEDLGWEAQTEAVRGGAPLTPEEARLLTAVGGEVVPVDLLPARTGLAPERVLALVGALEVKGWLADAGGGRVVALQASTKSLSSTSMTTTQTATSSVKSTK